MIRILVALWVGMLISLACSHPSVQTLLSQRHGSEHLLLTAVTHHPSPPHHSRLQCLNLTAHPFASYPTVGKSVFLASVSNATYVVLPPGSEEGWHRPPHPMFFVLLSGRARVETPSTGDSMIIEPGGRHQLILALDTLGGGHLTFYPSDVDTVALQLPLAPEMQQASQWELVHEGPCV